MISKNSLLIRNLGLVEYKSVWHEMLKFTDQRDKTTTDEIWIVQHPPVFTQGKAGKAEHLLNNDTNIPVIQSDRGGQITYHGPGQLVLYCLLDLNRLQIGIKTLVSLLEKSIISLLDDLNIKSSIKAGAPGVYIGDKKIAALGLRVRKACTLHGLSLNVDMDLKPFSYINSCGYVDLQATQIKDYVGKIDFDLLSQKLIKIIATNLKVNYVSKTS